MDIILKSRIGKSYGGLVDPGDAFALFADKSKCVITAMIMLKSDREIDMLEHIKKCFQEKVTNCSRLFNEIIKLSLINFRYSMSQKTIRKFQEPCTVSKDTLTG